jgi:mannose-1-phosphate guanylyltransferase / mannose-6-phosphate isomerase
LLVCPQSSSQKVKDVVSRLKEQGDERADIHQTVYRPWGTYTVLEGLEKHKTKNIRVMPKKRLSLQIHAHRSEYRVVVVVKDRACVEVDGEQRCLSEGESTYISWCEAQVV